MDALSSLPSTEIQTTPVQQEKTVSKLAGETRCLTSPVTTKRIHDFSRLTTPQPAVITSASIRITPEVDHINVENGESMWVAIEVTGGVVKTGRPVSTSAEFGYDLDVAIVIDNS